MHYLADKIAAIDKSHGELLGAMCLQECFLLSLVQLCICGSNETEDGAFKISSLKCPLHITFYGLRIRVSVMEF